MFGVKAKGGAAARRERNRQEMRGAILDVAREIIAAGGVDELTIRSVAQRLGYSPGALYEYFASKEAILEALYFESQDGLGTFCEHAVQNLPSEASAVDALIALGHAYRDHALAHVELYRMVFSEFKSPPLPHEATDPEDKPGGFGVLIRVVKQGIDAGVFVDLPPAALACAAWSAVHGFVSLELSGQITGGDGPGMPPPTPEAGKERRDQLFAIVEQMVLTGIVRPEHQPPNQR